MCKEVRSTAQLSSVAQSCPTLCDPMDCNMPGFPVHHQLSELAQIHIHPVGDATNHLICWSPAPAARESTWRDGQCRWETMQPLNFLGLHNFISSLRFFLYFNKSVRSEVWQFQFPFTQIYCFHKSLLPFKQSFCSSSSLRIVFTLTRDYTVTRA